MTTTANDAVDEIEFTTCPCGEVYRWTDSTEADRHREHRRPRWMCVSKGGWPREFGPWHLLTGTSRATAACGASLFRRNNYDTRTVTEKPAERLCRKCVTLPERPWESADHVKRAER